MRNNLVIILILILNSLNISQTKFFVKFRDNTPAFNIEQTLKQITSTNVSLSKNNSIPVFSIFNNLVEHASLLSGIYKIDAGQVLSASDLNNIKSRFSQIEYIQPLHTYHIDYIPDDPKISEQWALDKIGAFQA